MQSKGQLIVVEGLEGAGKSTALQCIQTYLAPKVAELLVTREPGGTEAGEILRTLIKEQALTKEAELLALYAARVELLEKVIRPALARGAFVLADRFELSTYAYQGGGRGIETNTIDALSALFVKGLEPHLLFYLDITPEIGLERAKLRGRMDRIEQESLDFFYRVLRAYHASLVGRKNVVIIDATQPIAAVEKCIIQALENIYLKDKDG